MRRLPAALAALLASCLAHAGAGRAWGAPAATGARPRPVLSLVETVSAVLKSDPDLASAQARLDQARQGLLEARLQSLPRLAWNGSAMRSDNPLFVFGSLLQQQKVGAQNFAVQTINHPGYLTNIQNSFEMGLPIFAGFDLSNGRALGKIAVERARRDLEAEGQKARFRAVSSFLELLRARSSVLIIEARIASSSDEIKDASLLAKKGLVLGSDFYMAQAILGGLEAGKTRLQSELNAQSERFSLLTSLDPEEFDLKGALTENSYPVSALQGVVAEALSRSPGLRQAALLRKAAAVSRAMQTEAILPRLDAFGSFQTNTRDFSTNPFYQTVGVKASMKFGDPAYWARRLGAAARERESSARESSAVRSVRMDVSRSYEEYEGALRSLVPIKETVARSRKALRLILPLYRSGRQSIVEVLRVESALAEIQAAQLEARLALHEGYARLLLSSGALDDPSVSLIDKHLEAAP